MTVGPAGTSVVGGWTGGSASSPAPPLPPPQAASTSAKAAPVEPQLRRRSDRGNRTGPTGSWPLKTMNDAGAFREESTDTLDITTHRASTSRPGRGRFLGGSSSGVHACEGGIERKRCSGPRPSSAGLPEGVYRAGVSGVAPLRMWRASSRSTPGSSATLRMTACAPAALSLCSAWAMRRSTSSTGASASSCSE